MDINNFTLQELVDLNRNIIKRIRELRRIKLYKALQNFTEGDMVSFDNNGITVTGTVIRINQKSLTVKTSESTWYIDPCLASKSQLLQQKNDVNMFQNIATNCSNN